MTAMIELPDDLGRRAEAQARQEGRSLSDLVTEGLRHVVDPSRAATGEHHKLSFPLIPETAQSPGVTPEQAHQALADEEAERYARFMRR